jgi:hypothetical protein
VHRQCATLVVPAQSGAVASKLQQLHFRHV